MTNTQTESINIPELSQESTINISDGDLPEAMVIADEPSDIKNGSIVYQNDSQQLQAVTSESEYDEDDDVINFAADNNTRFAGIIERMEILERENEVYKQRILEYETKHKLHIEETYEKEISDTRKLLDDLAKEKANMELDMAKMDRDLKDLKNDADKLSSQNEKLKKDNSNEKELSNAKSRHNTELKREVQDLSNNLAQIKNEIKKHLEDKKQAFAERDLYETESNKLRQDMAEKTDQIKQLTIKEKRQKDEIDQTRKACEREALTRVNCENTIATLKETLDFERKVHRDKLRELNGNMSENAIQSEFESRLTQALEEMRAEHEAEMDNTVVRLKYQYSDQISASESKVSNLQEKEREARAALKNSEMSRKMIENQKREESAQNKKAIYQKDREIEKLKDSLESAKSEKEKATIDLESRKAVWDENEQRLTKEVEEMKASLEAKQMQEQHLKSELSKFSSLMSAAEDRHKVPSPSRIQKRARKSKAEKMKRKRVSECIKIPNDTVNSTIILTPNPKQSKLNESSQKENKAPIHSTSHPGLFRNNISPLSTGSFNRSNNAVINLEKENKSTGQIRGHDDKDCRLM